LQTAPKTTVAIDQRAIADWALRSVTLIQPGKEQTEKKVDGKGGMKITSSLNISRLVERFHETNPMGRFHCSSFPMCNCTHRGCALAPAIAARSAGPESMLPMGVMDSLMCNCTSELARAALRALQAPRNDSC
jgi:hypothetical protein